MTDQSDRAGGDGMRMVPIEPTPEMAVAGRKALAIVADRMEEAKLLATSSIDFWQRVGHEPANEIYRAMIAATPPSGNAGESAEAKRCPHGNPLYVWCPYCQPAGERTQPVAWRNKNDFGQWSFSADPLWDTSELLYAAPPQPAPDGLPPIDSNLHTPDMIASLQHRALSAQPAPDAVWDALQKIAEWVDIKDPRHPETASGEEVEYGNGYSAGLRAAGKFARAALSPAPVPSDDGNPASAVQK